MLKKIGNVIVCCVMSLLLVFGGSNLIFGQTEVSACCECDGVNRCNREKLELPCLQLESGVFLTGEIEYTPGFDENGNKLFCEVNNAYFWVTGENSHKYWFSYDSDSYYWYASDNGRHIRISVWGDLYEEFAGKTFKNYVHKAFVCDIN